MRLRNNPELLSSAPTNPPSWPLNLPYFPVQGMNTATTLLIRLFAVREASIKNLLYIQSCLPVPGSHPRIPFYYGFHIFICFVCGRAGGVARSDIVLLLIVPVTLPVPVTFGHLLPTLPRPIFPPSFTFSVQLKSQFVSRCYLPHVTLAP